MVYIPDPMELLERAEERQMELIDENGTYPCICCGRRFNPDTMVAISAHPAASLECGRPDCAEQVEPKQVKGE